MERIRRLWREKRWLRWTVEGLLVLAVYLGIRAWQTRGAADGPAPELVATTIEGERIALSELADGPVMVHFWATWCGVCRAEEHNVRAVSEDHTVVTVATRSGSPADLAEYARDNGLEAPIVSDPTGQLAAAWGVSSLPTSFIVDPDGDIRHVEVGYTTEIGMRVRLWLAGL